MKFQCNMSKISEKNSDHFLVLYKILFILVIFVGCTMVREKQIPQDWSAMIESDTDVNLYGIGISQRFLDQAEQEARNKIITQLSQYITDSYLKDLAEEPEILEKRQKIVETLINKNEIEIIYRSTEGTFFLLMKLSKEVIDRNIEKAFSNFTFKKRVTFKDSQGNLISVWVNWSKFPSTIETIEGLYIGVDPRNPEYFQVDVAPCEKSGLVTVPGVVLQVKEVGERKCKNGKSYEWNKIVYGPK